MPFLQSTINQHTEKMTNEQQQLKARFLGLYIGSGAAITFKGKEPFWGIDYAEKRVRLSSNTWWPLRHCQLILRPLSSITDQEAIECAMCYNDEASWAFYKRNEHFAQVIDNESGELFTIWFPLDETSIITLIDCVDETCAFNQFTCIDWLRSKHFCLPFCGHDPIQEGWAILEPSTSEAQ